MCITFNWSLDQICLYFFAVWFRENTDFLLLDISTVLLWCIHRPLIQSAQSEVTLLTTGPLFKKQMSPSVKRMATPVSVKRRHQRSPFGPQDEWSSSLHSCYPQKRVARLSSPLTTIITILKLRIKCSGELRAYRDIWASSAIAEVMSQESKLLLDFSGLCPQILPGYNAEQRRDPMARLDLAQDPGADPEVPWSSRYTNSSQSRCFPGRAA